MKNIITQRYIITAFAVISAIVLSTSSSAQEKAATAERPNNLAIEKGIAFVNLAKIFKESAFIDSQRKKISADFFAREQKIEDRIDAIEKDRKELEKNRLTFTTEQSQKENDRLSEEELNIQRDTRDLSEDKRLRFDVAQRDLEKVVLETIQEISNERENFIVFDLSTILFADKRLEITDLVVKSLDEKMATSQ